MAFSGKIGKWYVTLGDEPFDTHRIPDYESDTEEDARRWLADRSVQVWPWPPKTDVIVEEIPDEPDL